MLTGKTAIVSGGTGAIGSIICKTFIDQGSQVAFTYNKNREKALELEQELLDRGGRCMHAQLNCHDEEGIEQFCAAVEKEFGPIDILVNNLGATQVLPFALIEKEDWDFMLQTNLTGMFLFSRAVVRPMIRRKAGSIINIGSIAGHRMLEVPVHYATAKAAVSGFTTSLAKELARYRIRVNEVVPGLIEGGIGTNVSQRQLDEYNQFCAMGRPGTPQEVADLVAFLASDKASYINAQSMIADGGL